MSDHLPSKMPGWLRDAAGAPPQQTPTPRRPGDLPKLSWRAMLRWLADRLLSQ